MKRAREPEIAGRSGGGFRKSGTCDYGGSGRRRGRPGVLWRSEAASCGRRSARSSDLWRASDSPGKAEAPSRRLQAGRGSRGRTRRGIRKISRRAPRGRFPCKTAQSGSNSWRRSISGLTFPSRMTWKLTSMRTGFSRRYFS
jgi:hypothetical protein